MKTKILKVGGEDYSAVDFETILERTGRTVREFWNKSNQAKKVLWWSDPMGDERFSYEALTFNEVDPNFIDWVKSEQDYDASKNSNFYVAD